MALSSLAVAAHGPEGPHLRHHKPFPGGGRTEGNGHGPFAGVLVDGRRTAFQAAGFRGRVPAAFRKGPQVLLDMGRILRQLTLRFPERAALINLERGRKFSYGQMHELSNRVSNFLTGRFGLGPGDFYGTILDNDNMALFHPWMFKSPVGGAWIDIRESALEQLAQIDHAAPKLVFLETRLLENLHRPLRAKGVEIVCMDPPGTDWPGVHDFWKLAEESFPAEVRADLHAYDSGRHAAVLRFTGGTTGKAKCAAYSLANIWFWGCNPAPLLRDLSLRKTPGAVFFRRLTMPRPVRWWCRR